MRDALRRSVAILVIVSPASLKSDWVPYELGFGIALDSRILPFLTHPAVNVPGYMADLKRLTSIPDCRKYFTSTFKAHSPQDSSIQKGDRHILGIPVALVRASSLCRRPPAERGAVLPEIRSTPVPCSVPGSGAADKAAI